MRKTFQHQSFHNWIESFCVCSSCLWKYFASGGIFGNKFVSPLFSRFRMWRTRHNENGSCKQREKPLNGKIQFVGSLSLNFYIAALCTSRLLFKILRGISSAGIMRTFCHQAAISSLPDSILAVGRPQESFRPSDLTAYGFQCHFMTSQSRSL